MTESKPEYGVLIAKDLMVPMRDGVRLATDVYRPAREGEAVGGKFPTILQRTIYDKTAATFAGPAEYFCKRGYVSVVQDCRGRFNSEGDYYHMANEALDGYDTVEWTAAEDWSNGKIGTFGTSYGSQVQSSLATQAPPHLSAMIPVEGPSNIYAYGLRHDGAFQLKFLTAGFWLGADSKEAAADPEIARAMETASDWLQTMPPQRGRSPLALLPDYERWVFDFMTRGDHEEYWDNPSFNIEANYLQHSDVPVYLVGGWYDSWTRAMMTHFVELSRRKKGPIKLLMGPWTHGDVSVSLTYSGDVDFGPTASLNGNLAEDFGGWRLRWFDRWLKGIRNRVEDEPPIKLFVMGGGTGRKTEDGRLLHGGRWRDESEWPLERTLPTSYYLDAAGGLGLDVPDINSSATTYLFDPNHPVPTISGNLSGLAEVVPMPEGVTGTIPPSARRRNLGLPGGAHQAERQGGFGCSPPYPHLADRSDVLVFETPPLTDNVEVTGPITAKLWASSSATDTDFTAKLVDVYPPNADYPEGYHLNICDGIVRARYREFTGKADLLKPGGVYEFSIILDPTSNLFETGHRIRLDISSSNFPRFDINPNTGQPVGRHTHAIVADNTIYHDAAHPSHVVLPIIPGDPIS
jgi:putative CocE/NonD family hydrolase